MSLPIAVIDTRSPQEAIDNLSKNFSVIPFITENITYDAIAGHPDIFITQCDNISIVAPNTPNAIKQDLIQNSRTLLGHANVGTTLEDSTLYNCLITNTFLFHKKGYTDRKILERNADKVFIDLPQAYTRCSLFEIAENAFITSDKGIASVLQNMKIEHICISPEGIQLPPYKYGFIGGCMGKYKETIYLNGSLSMHKDGDAIKSFIFSHNCDIVELHQGNLYDGGGIFFFD